jgi:P-type Ca2+ transporter type 2C
VIKTGGICLQENLIGLSKREAAARLSKYGPNTISHGRKLSVLKLFFSQFKQLIVLILIASTLISAFMGELTEAAVIIAIVIVNAFMGFIQE